MKMEWQLDNPSIALANYHSNYDTFVSKKGAKDLLEDELKSRTNELNQKQGELESKKAKLDGMGEYVKVDVDSQIKMIEDEIQQKISETQKEFDSKKAELSSKKYENLQVNDKWLSERLKQLLGDNGDVNVELSEIEKKALEFEISRRQFVTSSNERINNYQDGITQEKLECKTIVGQWKQEQDDISAKCAPDISKYKKIIDDINRKHQPDIRQFQNFVSEKVSARDEELGQLQSEREREIQLADNEIAGYKRDYKQTEKQFNEQIRMAKLQNKPTTRMENSRASRLNSINDQIQKVNNSVNKKLSSIDQKISAAQSKNDKYIEKAEDQLNGAIKKRNQELSEPSGIFDRMVSDRDGQINSIQSKIDQREGTCNNKVNDLNSSVNNERSAQEKHHQEVDSQIVTYVMTGETCFSEVLNEAYAPFIALQDKIDGWMELLTTIKKDKMSSTYQTEHDKQRALLSTKEYSVLNNDLSEAQQYDGQISAFAKNNGILKIVGGTVCGVGVMLTLVLYFVLHSSSAFGCLLLSVIGVAIAVLTITKTNKEFSQICKYISLASDYQNFAGISSHSTQVTQERELERMKNIGNKLYDIHYGKTEAQNAHDAKDTDIKADYERELKLVTIEFQSAKAEYDRERDKKVAEIIEDASDGEARFTGEKEEAQNGVNVLIQRISAIHDSIIEMQTNIENSGRFIDAFESNYRVLEKNLQDSKWMTPMDYTHGKLANDLYVVSENGELDEYGHKKIYRIAHNKKALVVTYDISCIGDGDGSQVEEVGKLIRDLMFDFMYSVYRMNSKEAYSQFIVDEVGGTNELKSNNVKNAFNIVEVVGKIDDIKGRLKAFASQRESLAEKGTKIDDVNEMKYKKQDRPEIYNILYIIYKPNERKNKLDDDIRTLIPECDKYGFLPVFVCEKDTWEREIQEKESIYKDIKSLVNNTIVTFDGTKYADVI